MLAPILKTRNGLGDGTQMVAAFQRGMSYTIPREAGSTKLSSASMPDVDASAFLFPPQSANFASADSERAAFVGTTGFVLGGASYKFSMNIRYKLTNTSATVFLVNKYDGGGSGDSWTLLHIPQTSPPVVSFIVREAGAITFRKDWDATSYNLTTAWYDLRITRNDQTYVCSIDGNTLTATEAVAAAVDPGPNYTYPTCSGGAVIFHAINLGAPSYSDGNIQDFRISNAVDGPFDRSRPFA